MQGIQPSERGSLLSPTVLCPQTLFVIILFVPFIIIRRYFQGGGNFSPHRDHIHHPGHPSMNDSPLNRPGVEEEYAKNVVGAICHGPPARHRQSQRSAVCGAIWQHRIAPALHRSQLLTYPKQHLKPHLKPWIVQSLCIHVQEVLLPSLALPTVPGLHSPIPLIHKINRLKSTK